MSTKNKRYQQPAALPTDAKELCEALEPLLSHLFDKFIEARDAAQEGCSKVQELKSQLTRVQIAINEKRIAEQQNS